MKYFITLFCIVTASFLHAAGWNSSFTLNGVEGDVYATAIVGTNYYIGGNFTIAGDKNIKNIAKWDGTSWQALGTGVNGWVRTLKVQGTSLLVGGDFTTAGGAANKYIAKWSGTAWSGFGSGFNDYVYTINVNNNTVFAGGLFDSSGTVACSKIAKWNGSTWVSLTKGISDTNAQTYAAVYAIGFYQNNILAAGKFTKAGDSLVRNIAKFDTTTQLWSKISKGCNGTIFSLATFGTKMYVGGQFDIAGADTNSRYIAQYDFSTLAWSPLKKGLNHWVKALQVNATGQLYAVGYFNREGDTVGSILRPFHIVKWDGTNWSSLGQGIDRPLFSVAELSGKILVGGLCETGSSTSLAHVAVFDGVNWSSLNKTLNKSVNGKVNAICISKNRVIVGGEFGYAKDSVTPNIAVYRSTGFGTFKFGTSAAITALATDTGGNIIAGGWFKKAGSKAVNHIARWNDVTQQWDTIGLGVNGVIRAIAVDKITNKIFIGGKFTTTGNDTTLLHIAKWSGSAWINQSKGFFGTRNSEVHSLVFNKANELIAGGNFTKANADSSTVNYIAKWNGTKWIALGTGCNAIVYSVAVDTAGVLFAGGLFTNAGGIAVNRLAKWNGSVWADVNGGVVHDSMAAFVNSIFTINNRVIVGGQFSKAGAVNTNNVAYLENGVWKTLGTGVNAQVNTVFAKDTEVYVGGIFNNAGGVVSNYFGAYSVVLRELETGIEPVQTNTGIALYPNPNNGAFTISIDAPNTASCKVEIFSITGERVYSKTTEPQSGKQLLNIPQLNLAAGNYVVKVSQLENSWTTKCTVVE